MKRIGSLAATRRIIPSCPSRYCSRSRAWASACPSQIPFSALMQSTRALSTASTTSTINKDNDPAPQPEEEIYKYSQDTTIRLLVGVSTVNVLVSTFLPLVQTVLVQWRRLSLTSFSLPITLSSTGVPIFSITCCSKTWSWRESHSEETLLGVSSV